MLGALKKDKANLAARLGTVFGRGEFLLGFSQPSKAEWDFNKWKRLGLLGGSHLGKNISS